MHVLLQESKLPKPPAYIFMIDVSVHGLHHSLLNLLSQHMLQLLEKLPRCVHMYVFISQCTGIQITCIDLSIHISMHSMYIACTFQYMLMCRYALHMKLVCTFCFSCRDEEGKSPVQVGFVTFDKALHFYNVLVSEYTVCLSVCLCECVV